MAVHLFNVLMTAFVATIILVVCVFVLVIIICRTTAAAQLATWWHSLPVVLFRLGGVTTLRRRLNYPCTLCQDSMEAGDKVRTLSCGHAFHCGATVKCKNDIDKWLRTAPQMSCPLCRQIPHPVLPWKRPPPSSPAASTTASAATSTSDLEAGLLLPAPRSDEALPDAHSSSSASAPPLAQLPGTSTTDSKGKEVLLPPVDDETPPEAHASSSASTPPPAQLPGTSTTDSAEGSPLPTRDETLPEASSSQ